ncbi:hypothetical protein REPUB_Repub13aG0067600 [Reevesia pubescens]
MKLREAHKGSSKALFCSILWGLQAHQLVTASSFEPFTSIHDPHILSNPPKILRHHRDRVNALALSPNYSCLAFGSIDHSVKLYKFPVSFSPGGEFGGNIQNFEH